MSRKNRKKPKPQTKPLTAEQRQKKKLKDQAKLERQKIYQWVFMNGKLVRVKRPELIDGLDPEEYIRRNACDIWLTQNQRYDILHERAMAATERSSTEPVEEEVDYMPDWFTQD